MNTIREILRANFKIDQAEITELWGYDNKNYKVKTIQGIFVLKQYSDVPNLSNQLEAENEVLLMLSATLPGYFQEPVKAQHGDYLIHAKDGKPI